MKNKFLAISLSAMVLGLTACSSSTTATTAPAETTTAQTEASTAAQSEATTAAEAQEESLTVWAWDPNFNINALKKAEAIYQKNHPNFKLNIQEMSSNDIVTKIIAAAESGDLSTLPDIYLSQDFAFHKNVGAYPEVYVDLTDSGIDFSKFTAGKLADSTVDGKNYGVPFDNGASIMAVRTDYLEEAGLTSEDFNNITWSKFAELGKIVLDKTGHPMLTTSGGSELVLQMLQSSGVSPMKDGNVFIKDNETLAQCITIYNDLVAAGVIAEYTDWDQYIASMNDGKVAGVINGCWIMASIQAAEDQSGKWAIVNLPSVDGVATATHNSNCGGSSWAVTSNTKNKELAFDFLKSTFGSSMELYDQILETGAIASYMPAAESNEYQKGSDFYSGQKVFADIIDFAGKVPAFDCGAYYGDIRDVLNATITDIVQGKTTVEKGLENAQAEIEFKISE